ncbi:MBL fold metallo-hydrolase [Selenomonadales bacterium OttesenSCG-928-I06]|nr:MBL fold metallo-hydrolase [Selenomonadales bacterium OttesenSCG-928-I06]
MQIIRAEIRSYGTNCYILFCEDTLQAVIIDPAGQEKGLLDVIEKNKLKIKYIINTHGHPDHIGANSAIKKATDASILFHEKEAPMLAKFIGKGAPGAVADKFIDDGDTIEFGNVKLQVIHTPGHTQGGICLYNEKEKVLFSGDTLFAESIGRTDFPGGSYPTIISSIKNKLLVLPDETTVYSGHGEATTIAHEKKYNPFVS